MKNFNFEHQFWLFCFWKITIIQSQLTSSYVGKCFKIVIQHIERGTLRKLCVFHFITMKMLMLAMFFVVFLICFMEQVFQKTWGLLIEGRHQANSTFTIIMVMKWDASSFCKVPILMCCIAIVLWVTSQYWWNIVSDNTQWNYLILMRYRKEMQFHSFHSLPEMYNKMSNQRNVKGNLPCRPSWRHAGTIRDQLFNWEWSNYFPSNSKFLMLKVCALMQTICVWACIDVLYMH